MPFAFDEEDGSPSAANAAGSELPGRQLNRQRTVNFSCGSNSSPPGRSSGSSTHCTSTTLRADGSSPASLNGERPLLERTPTRSSAPFKLQRASTIGRLSFTARTRARSISSNTLAYDTHSWVASFTVLTKGLLQDSFLIVPWFLLTLYATVLAILDKCLPDGVGVQMEVHDASILLGITGSMALMLTFRLNVCYNRCLSQTTQDLIVMLAGCERLVNTPCPAGYVGILRMVLLVFLLVLPFILLDDLGFLAVPMCSITVFATLAVEEVAMHIEQPFGKDDDDLPILAYNLALEADLLAMLDEDPYADD